MLSRISGLLFLIIAALLAGCGILRQGTPTPLPTPLAGLPAALSPGEPIWEQTWIAEADGEAVLEVRAWGPGTAWQRRGAEAATLGVYLDGEQKADVVLYLGSTSHIYPVLLGEVAQGEHRLRLEYEPEKSAREAQGVQVEDVKVQLYQPDHPLYLVIQHAPIIYGRRKAGFSDVPLVMSYEQEPAEEGPRLRYTVIFSNEDGGTPPEGLMARWGRLTDIEWIYEVTLDEAGEPVAAFYQGDGHEMVKFRGEWEGMHPLLRVVTKNNMVTDRGRSDYRFALVPLTPLPDDHSREEVMDRFPWTYAVMAAEWAREGQEHPTDPDTPAVGDPRDYLYIEFLVQEPESHPCPVICSRGAWAVRLRDDPTWYSSDHGQEKLRVRLRNWHRVTIELPPGTQAEQITQLRFQAFIERKSSLCCAITLARVSRAFLLDEEYKPGPSLLTHDEPITLDTDPDTETPAEIVFEVRGR